MVNHDFVNHDADPRASSDIADSSRPTRLGRTAPPTRARPRPRREPSRRRAQNRRSACRIAGRVLDRAAADTGRRRQADHLGGRARHVRVAILQVDVDRQVGRRRDRAAASQNLVARDDIAPSARPSAFARPRLVVASASKPSDASRRAVPASHGFGMMNAPGRSCIARNAAAFSA